MAAATPSVLVLGTIPSLIWQVTRCLRRAGHGCRPMRWRLRAAQEPSFLARLQQLSDSGQHIVAADEHTVLLLVEALPHLHWPTSMGPQASLIRSLQDKWNLTRLLDALKLPTPDSVRANDAAELWANSLVYPIITKPLDHMAAPGLQLYRTREALARRRLSTPYPLLAQSYVPGWDVGASFLARQGCLAACSVYRHTRRGARTFYPSVRVREYVGRFVAACRYSGVGHLQLRYDPVRDSYVILGLEPCFPASLLYAEQAGLNYPDLLLRLDGGRPERVAVSRNCRVRLSAYEHAMMYCLRDRSCT